MFLLLPLILITCDYLINGKEELNYFNISRPTADEEAILWDDKTRW